MAKEKAQDVNIAVMANDIQYIKSSLARVENTLAAMDGHYLRVEDFGKHLKEHEDFRRALQDLDNFKTQVKTWGTAALIILGIAQFLISKFL